MTGWNAVSWKIAIWDVPSDAEKRVDQNVIVVTNVLKVVPERKQPEYVPK